MLVLGGLAVPISINPWMLLPLVVLGVAFYFLLNYFITTARELRRLDNIERSPLYVHTNSTLEGICTVRSSQKLDILKKEFEELCDNHTRPFYGFLIVHRWFGLRMDCLCSIYAAITLFACIFLRGK